MPRWLALLLALALSPLPARADAPIGPVARLLFPSAYEDSIPQWELSDPASDPRSFDLAGPLDHEKLDQPSQHKGSKPPLAKTGFRIALFLGPGAQRQADEQAQNRLRRVELPYHATPPPTTSRAARI